MSISTHESASARRIGRGFGRERLARSRIFVADLFRSPLAALGMAVLLLILVVAVAAPLIAPNDPAAIEITRRLKPPFWLPRGSTAFPLGTDSVGRDILSRVIFGSRVSLLIGISSVVLGGTLGIGLGLLSGYYGGLVDDLIMRLGDIQLAFPFILLAVTVLAVVGSGLINVILVLGIANWVTYGRVVRAEVMSLREKEFVEAARAVGVSNRRIMVRHVLPNTYSSIIVITSFAVANTILSEASLSFLGLGVPASIPSWGAMVAEGRDFIVQGWWLVTFPGLAVAGAVLGINLVGDWLRDYLDPRLKDV